ncbi:sugar nucleotide-binding protein [Thalassospira xiamenensis]|uniref:sugar nucleotide-binding protein n=1 Tax=Thalassospira xiamenensis TaxID=220697 RepID=UPI000A68929B|nr:sugar nucleotide-binding protein [Thalassospira xiamenensis]MCD1595232.1 sugar nucleotide-binding protein [Thalassospira xiamenensis]
MSEYLLVGGNGFLSGHIKHWISVLDKSTSICETQRDLQGQNSLRLQLDLAGDLCSWPEFPAGLKSVFIGAAITSQAEVAADLARSKLVNVDRTLLLARTLLGSGAHIVFPSTNLVLPCNEPQQAETTALRPNGTYAEQKAAVENSLMDVGGKVAVCRLPKVLSTATPLIAKWVDMLRAKGRIEAFDDLYISPVSGAYASRVLALIMVGQASGVFQVASREDLSYYELALAIASKLGVSSALVRPVSVQTLGGSLQSQGRYPSMSGQNVEKTFGVLPQSLDELLDELLT